MEQRGKRRRDNASSLSKRLRRHPHPLPTAGGTVAEVDDGDSVRSHSSSSSSPPPLVMVTGLPSDCTVLELKSRLELYGPISRTRIDAVDGSGYVTFRSNESAEAAISASLDPAIGIDIRSYKVVACRASDPLMGWKTVAGANAPSKLLRAEIPLSKHGRSKKNVIASIASTKSTSTSEPTFKGREIVAYDDLF